MKYVLTALITLAAYEAFFGQIQESVLCLIIASGALVEAPPVKKAS